MESFLVVGLGNPGQKYSKTRHNAGALAVDELCAQQPGLRFGVHRRSNTELADYRLGTRRVILAKLRSFMNNSGQAVGAIANFYTLPPERIIAIYDELELPLGEVAWRKPGAGDHGHKGLKSISTALKTRDYHRIAIGIGRPPGQMPPASYVLKPFSSKEQVDVSIACAQAADLVHSIISVSSAL